MNSDSKQLNCKELVEIASDYIEGTQPAALRQLFEDHLTACANCRTYLEQMRQTVGTLANLKDDWVPEEEKQKLLDLFRGFHAGNRGESQKQLQLGICDAHAAHGDHIAYFWESEQDFERGVKVLEEGLRSDDAGFVFGYQEANEKVLGILKIHGFEVGRLMEQQRLFILEGAPSGEAMLSSIAAAFGKAMEAGARTLRLLGNIGWRRAGWPGDEDILAFEAKVTQAARSFPCLIICMYDVRSLAGRIILKGGFETHPLTICGEALRENPYHVPLEPFLAQLRRESRVDFVQ